MTGDETGRQGDSEDTDRKRTLGDRAGGLSRRQFLGATGGGLLAVGGARAAYNTVLGYGELGYGTNLREQDLGALVGDSIGLTYDERIGESRVRLVDDATAVWVDGPERTMTLDIDSDDETDGRHVSEDVAAADAEFGLGGRLVELSADTAAFTGGHTTFEFLPPSAFFEYVGDRETCPEIVAAVRGAFDRDTGPDTVRAFTGADPSDTEAVVDGLKTGFREHGRYDIPRYLAGSVEDNVLLGAVDLRRHFEDPVDFESLLATEETGLFCWELVFRSMEALQAVSPRTQTVPVAACYVTDSRHKHAFTGVLSAVRGDDGRLELPMTFVDYTYSTLYDDLRLTGVSGEGLAAYDTSHRADDIHW